MQPYFLPYIGYWQLLSVVDAFVVYDDVQYTKKGWISRNRFLQNGQAAFFSVSLKKDSDYLDVRDRRIAADFDRVKILNQLRESYRKAPQFDRVWPLVESVVREETESLFEFIHLSIRTVARHLAIRTPIVVSSTLPMDRSLRGQQRVVATCQAMRADHYLNAIGGRELYDKSAFAQSGIELRFLQTRPIVYPQFRDTFVPDLSIVDVMMFNSTEAIHAMLGEYDLV